MVVHLSVLKGIQVSSFVICQPYHVGLIGIGEQWVGEWLAGIGQNRFHISIVHYQGGHLLDILLRGKRHEIVLAVALPYLSIDGLQPQVS